MITDMKPDSGKSALAAGVAMLVAFSDCEMGAQVYCVASNRDQAKAVFAEAKNMSRLRSRRKTRS